ncbi:ABC transporter ATP-binding protein [Halocalculus aciditolerans]|uniref:ABC transporter ATP-binding protein n=1 Tax=Halocalculus aciditolerans TaxID=1383812 RepID=A0A830F5U1_9EURY|nr:ABC transporter ATP-binding protein [Halocalculus aciditolerans]GGL66023.1 ABC transporter ATP-binding protein [Halocalculus aciditolerans]
MTDLLTVDDVHVSYGDMEVIRDANLSVPEGEVVSIVGANGAGKTTLLDTVSGVKDIDSGDIEFEGESVVGYEPYERIDKGLAYVPERHRVFPEMTVAENLRTAMIPASDVDESAQLDRVFDLFPILSERQSQVASTMSGGQQQMLAIAQGLVIDPDLIMFDEPTLGLAPKIVEDIRDTISEISESGVTVLVADEQIEFAKHVSDRMYLMRKNTLNYLGERGEFEDAYQETVDNVFA